MKTMDATLQKRLMKVLRLASAIVGMFFPALSSANTIFDVDIPEPAENPYEALVSSILGTKPAACRSPQIPSEEIMQFWKTTLDLNCADKKCSAFVYSPQSISRLQSLMEKASDQFLVDAVSQYAARKNVDVQDFLSDTVEQIFSVSGISSRERLAYYKALIPLLERHAMESGDSVWFKKMQAIHQSLDQHVHDRTLIRCTYVEDTDQRMQVAFDVTDWASGKAFVPFYSVPEEKVMHHDALNLGCEVTFVQSSDVCSFSSSTLKSALDDMHFALRARDQDAVEGSGDALLMAIQQTREELGWAAGFNPNWSHQDLSDISCRLQVVTLQLLSQDRVVMAARLDRAFKQLIPGYNFYTQLVSTEKCSSKLRGTYKEAIAQAYEEHSDVYHWILQNFSADKRKKLDKSFASWTKKVKPAPARFRRLAASFTALSLGEIERAGRFADGIELKLNRFNNPQIFGYEFGMLYARGNAPGEAELMSRLNDLAQKSVSHMYSSLCFAYDFMSASEKTLAFKSASNFSLTLSPRSAAIFSAKYWSTLVRSLNQAKTLRTGIWVLNQAWYAWTPAIRARVAKQLVRWCVELEKEDCVQQIGQLFMH